MARRPCATVPLRRVHARAPHHARARRRPRDLRRRGCVRRRLRYERDGGVQRRRAHHPGGGGRRGRLGLGPRPGGPRPARRPQHARQRRRDVLRVPVAVARVGDGPARPQATRPAGRGQPEHRARRLGSVGQLRAHVLVELRVRRVRPVPGRRRRDLARRRHRPVRVRRVRRGLVLAGRRRRGRQRAGRVRDVVRRGGVPHVRRRRVPRGRRDLLQRVRAARRRGLPPPTRCGSPSRRTRASRAGRSTRPPNWSRTSSRRLR